MMTADAFARQLGCAKRIAGGWMVPCPAHGDRDPSLSIRDGKDGKLLVRCHAGCDQRRVIAALQERGLWVANAPRSRPSAHSQRTPARDAGRSR